jgi:hypothetical protein
MYWTLQNLKDSENKQKILHYGSIRSVATVTVQRSYGLQVVDVLTKSCVLVSCIAQLFHDFLALKTMISKALSKGQSSAAQQSDHAVMQAGTND